jgi:crotonobetaine/carnitine-CoA ligase
MEDVVDLLEARAAEAPGKLWLAWEPFEGPGREWTRLEFLHDVQRVAGALTVRGVTVGDRVLVHADNCPALLLTWFACAWLGAVCVVLNPKSASNELAYFAHHTGAVGIVTQAGLAAAPALSEDGLRFAITLHDSASDASNNEFFGTPVPRAHVDAASPACMMFTSGTTSRPKAVVWSRANALWAAESGCRGAGLLPSDIALVFVPLYHVVGLAWSVLPALQAGACIVLQPRFSASRFWPVAIARRATFASHVQFSSSVLAKQPVPQGHSFRLWCNSTWLPEYERHFGVPIIGWWGMTELVAPGIMGRHGMTQQPGTIGYAAPGYTLRTAGSSALQAGDVGDIEVLAVPGKTIFAGYFNDPEATASAFTADGWFRTGDRMRVHADGSIQFMERARDVIKTGGEGVSPAEIERVVRQVPGVADVSVVGRPDPAYGEVGVAFVVATADAKGDTALAQRITDACRVQLASFKVPREVRFIDSLPLVGINKVAKGELRRLAALNS